MELQSSNITLRKLALWFFLPLCRCIISSNCLWHPAMKLPFRFCSCRSCNSNMASWNFLWSQWSLHHWDKGKSPACLEKTWCGLSSWPVMPETPCVLELHFVGSWSKSVSSTFCARSQNWSMLFRANLCSSCGALRKTFVLDFSAQTSFWHLTYLDPFQPLWLYNFQVEQGHSATSSLPKMLKVRHETEELLLSCLCDDVPEYEALCWRDSTGA